MMKLSGLKNCDRCRAARKWLDGQGMEYRFHDLRADGLDPARLEAWIAAVGWEALLNRRSTTWRGLDEAQRSGLTVESAEALMQEFPTLVKRPVLEHSGGVCVGFTPAQYAAELAGAG